MRKLQILGTGCPKCKKLAEVVDQAAKELGIDYEIEKISEVQEIMKFGVIMVPGLVVDGEVKVAGKVPSVEDIKRIIA